MTVAGIARVARIPVRPDDRSPSRGPSFGRRDDRGGDRPRGASSGSPDDRGPSRGPGFGRRDDRGSAIRPDDRDNRGPARGPGLGRRDDRVGDRPRGVRPDPRRDNRDRDKPRVAKPAEPEAAKPRQSRPEKTLERVLSKAGLASRTTARSWIHERRVEVNGKLVENPDEWINFKNDEITIDGRPLSAEKKIYLLLYKPKGFRDHRQRSRRTPHRLRPDQRREDLDIPRSAASTWTQPGC